MLTADQISGALSTLNAHYGRGHVGSIVVYLDGKVEWQQRHDPRLGRTEHRIARVKGNTVFALGHQRTVKVQAVTA